MDGLLVLLTFFLQHFVVGLHRVFGFRDGPRRIRHMAAHHHADLYDGADRGLRPSTQGYGMSKLRHELQLARPLAADARHGARHPNRHDATDVHRSGLFALRRRSVCSSFSQHTVWHPTHKAIQDRAAGRRRHRISNGVLGGLTGLGGIISTISCQFAAVEDKQRAVFQPVLFAAFVIMAISQLIAGSYTVETVKLYGIGLPFMVAGIWIGFKLYGTITTNVSQDGVDNGSSCRRVTDRFGVGTAAGLQEFSLRETVHQRTGPASAVGGELHNGSRHNRSGLRRDHHRLRRRPGAGRQQAFCLRCNYWESTRRCRSRVPATSPEQPSNFGAISSHPEKQNFFPCEVDYLEIRTICAPARALKRGRLAVVTERWRGLRWTLWRQAGSLAGRNVRSVRRSRVVLAPRPWRLYFAGAYPADNGDKKRRSPGRARSKSSNIAWGKPGCLGCTCSPCPCASHMGCPCARRTGSTGAVSARLSPAPSVRERDNEMQNPGEKMSQERRHLLRCRPGPPGPIARPMQLKRADRRLC